VSQYNFPLFPFTGAFTATLLKSVNSKELSFGLSQERNNREIERKKNSLANNVVITMLLRLMFLEHKAL
jgi:hypothetical protein